MPKKEPDNWWPGKSSHLAKRMRQKAEPFRRGVVIDDPKSLLPRKGKEGCKPVYVDQPALPMEVGYLKPVLCPDCRGIGRVKKGRICRECQGKGVVPAEPTDEE